ncbi:MAG: AAA family ATPase, partial [Clostridia bacterium]|nr:AAA family ATPase [Clostridia bacterium]
DGRITDGQGRTVDFKNTIIILTSNLGSDIILNGMERDGTLNDGTKEAVMQLLRASFKPEFLNRIDEIVLYKPLTESDLSKIIELLLISLKKRLADKQIGLEVTDSAKKYIIENGSDPVYGARPLKRFLRSKVESAAARAIIESDPAPDSVLRVDCVDGELTVGF